MEIRENKKGQVMVVELQGRVDSLHAEELKTRLIEISDSEKQILVDCHQLEYISSAGLGVFLLMLKTQSNAGGRFSLCCLSDRIREVFAISGFDRIFTVFPSQEEALKGDSPLQGKPVR